VCVYENNFYQTFFPSLWYRCLLHIKMSANYARCYLEITSPVHWNVYRNLHRDRHINVFQYFPLFFDWQKVCSFPVWNRWLLYVKRLRRINIREYLGLFIERNLAAICLFFLKLPQLFFYSCLSSISTEGSFNVWLHIMLKKDVRN
jgi:hypothetical protein